MEDTKRGLVVLSLFDGMSCGMLALERAGISVGSYYASEVDKHAIKVSKENHPDIKHIGSVTNLSYKDGVLNTETGSFYVGDIDLVIGGSPCTGFSMAGKQLAFDDVQSKLYFEYERLVKEVLLYNSEAKFLLENVVMKKIHQDVITERLGVNPIAINSSLLSAQSRARLYWTNIDDIGEPVDKGITLSDVLQNYRGGWRVYTKKNPKKPKPNQAKAGCLTAGANSGGNHSDMDVIVYSESNIPLDSSGRISIKSEHTRRYSCEEWEILQTVPQGYTKYVSNSQRYKMLGNGWTVDVIAHIFKGLTAEGLYLH